MESIGMIGALLFFSTTVWVGNPLMIGCLALAAMFWATKKKRRSDLQSRKANTSAFVFLAFLGILATANYASNRPSLENFERSYLGAFPYLALLPLSYFIALQFTMLDRKIFTALVALEILVGLIEFTVGTRSIVGARELGMTEIGETSYLYFNRVYGLSANSSTFAQKIVFFSMFCLPASGVPTLWKFKSEKLQMIAVLIALGFLFVGMLVTFNRSTIFACTIQLALFILTTKEEKRTILIACGILTFFAAVFLLVKDPKVASRALNYVGEQLSVGGRSPLEFSSRSGRGLIYNMYTDFLSKHLVFGNSSIKAWIWLDGSLYHAHNSYLMLLASNGIFIGGVFLVGYIHFFCRKWMRVLPILLFSITQYGLLWGFSASDVLFFHIASLRTAVPNPLEVKRQRIK